MSADAEWHAWRRGGIGGSDIAALIGLSKYASPTSLYYQKVGILDDVSEDTQRQRIGKRMEAVLAAEFHDETGLYVIGEQTWCKHPLHEWARCTVDGFVGESPDSGMGDHISTIEFKTDGRFGWDEIPPHIRAQTIWQMGITGIQHCYLVAMFAGFRVQTFEIPWDEAAISDWTYMLEVARVFWRDHVQAQVPPPVDDHDATTDALARVYNDPEGYLVADDAAVFLVDQLRIAKAETKLCEATEATLANQIRDLLGDKTDLVDCWLPDKRGGLKAHVIASWRPQTSRRIDTTALRAAKPEIAAKFTTTTESRVLRVGLTKGE